MDPLSELLPLFRPVPNEILLRHMEDLENSNDAEIPLILKELLPFAHSWNDFLSRFHGFLRSSGLFCPSSSASTPDLHPPPRPSPTSSSSRSAWISSSKRQALPDYSKEGSPL
ncbi:Hypothetical protein FKW44_006085 [Caligus rogercresseyi]|uniref:Uncharacterized protein n=1 Tax=Caligus rogercresseyi TaxID=217165 RepID=A0A7T8KCU4_CALRO|nr:Hypothetical protein FKW44_006085 [Caligus rogercresseyi]